MGTDLKVFVFIFLSDGDGRRRRTSSSSCPSADEDRKLLWRNRTQISTDLPEAGVLILKGSGGRDVQQIIEHSVSHRMYLIICI